MHPNNLTSSSSGKSVSSGHPPAHLEEALSSLSVAIAPPPPSTGKGGKGGGEVGEGAEGPEGAASSSSFSGPAAVAPPPVRFDRSIVDAAQDRKWDQVKSLHEEAISLDSVNEVRGSHHCTIMTCN